MAGGTWTSQNKVRPGAYINFKAVPAPSSMVGTRGIMTMPVPMNWGKQGELTELFSTDLLDGRSLAKIGYSATDEEALIFRLALQNCYKAFIYRLDTGGAKATAEAGNLTATAKYAGTLGNRIAVVVAENSQDTNYWDVITLFKESEKDRQTILKTTGAEALKNNDFVDFSGAGQMEVTAAAGVYLKGGTNGTITSDAYTNYFALVKGAAWNTMAIPQDISVANETVKSAVIALIRDLRNNQGKKVQAMLLDSTTNFEGIISVRNGYNTVNEVITPAMFTAFAAGVTAGANVDESNTYKVVEGAVSINYLEGEGPYSNEDIIKHLQGGQFILAARQDGAIVIEQDINTLHVPYPSADVNYSFSKNRVIRTLDEINNTVKGHFETTYLGKVDNNDDGRNLFKADIIRYMTQLQNMGAVQNFDSATDVAVLAGDQIDSVVVELAVQPVDSMEKLYMTVNVN